MLEWLECEHLYFASDLTCIKVFQVYLASLTLSGGIGDCRNPPPPLFGFSLVPVFAFLLGFSFGQFAHPLSKYPCINERKSKNFAVKKVGGGGGGCNNPHLLRGKGWQQK